MEVLVLFLGLYLVPIIIAVLRRHQHTAAIAIVSIFLGWTFIGFVVALAWAVMPVKHKPRKTLDEMLWRKA